MVCTLLVFRSANVWTMKPVPMVLQHRPKECPVKAKAGDSVEVHYTVSKRKECMPGR